MPLKGVLSMAKISWEEKIIMYYYVESQYVGLWSIKLGIKGLLHVVKSSICHMCLLMSSWEGASMSVGQSWRSRHVLLLVWDHLKKKRETKKISIFLRTLFIVTPDWPKRIIWPIHHCIMCVPQGWKSSHVLLLA